MDNSRKKRRLTAYKFFMKACIKDLKGRYPKSTIILPLVSKLCAQKWTEMDEDMKLIFQIEAGECERHRMEQRLPDYVIPPADRDDPPNLEMFNKLRAEQSSVAGILPSIQGAPDGGQIDNQVAGTFSNTMKTCTERSVWKSKRKTTSAGPRRPLSAFVWFCKDERRHVRKENPGLRMGEISKILGKMWHGLDREVKLKYQRISQEDRSRYSQELASFKEQEKPKDKEKSKGRKKSKAKLLTCSTPAAEEDVLPLTSIKEEPLDVDTYEEMEMLEASENEIDPFFASQEEMIEVVDEVKMELSESEDEAMNLSLRLECDEKLSDISEDDSDKENMAVVVGVNMDGI